MVEHVVLFKTTPEATPEQKQRAMAELKALKEKIPGIVDLTVGANFSERSQGYDIGLVVRFVDRAALEVYLPHPAHRGCVDEFIAPIKADVIVVDYDID
ncbi:MAG TPA: Dabb family protein [Armatimonadota bacterium]|nr:Dabb family protein [Armatimonadota bacterium]